MTADEINEYIRRDVATWPPLTPEQRARLAILLRPLGAFTTFRGVQ